MTAPHWLKTDTNPAPMPRFREHDGYRYEWTGTDWVRDLNPVKTNEAKFAEPPYWVCKECGTAHFEAARLSDTGRDEKEFEELNKMIGRMLAEQWDLQAALNRAEARADAAIAIVERERDMYGPKSYPWNAIDGALKALREAKP